MKPGRRSGHAGDGPPSPAAGPVRLARVGVLGSASLLLACLAHVVGGGRLPSAAVLVVAGLVLALAAGPLTARRCRLALLLGVLGLEQLLLHVSFDASTALAAGCPPVVAGHLAGAHPMTCSPAGAGMDSPGWTMWAGHLVATAMTAWLLARGEAWLWRVADRLLAVATASPSRCRRPRASLRSTTPLTVFAVVGHRPAAPRGPPAPVVVS